MIMPSLNWNFHGGTEENHENLSQHNFPCRDMNPVSSQYARGATCLLRLISEHEDRSNAFLTQAGNFYQTTRYTFQNSHHQCVCIRSLLFHYFENRITCGQSTFDKVCTVHFFYNCRSIQTSFCPMDISPVTLERRIETYGGLHVSVRYCVARF
jgi:hypothetical protein